jgi:predicted dehydrogenase
MKEENLSRRNFLKTSTAAAVAPMILPSGVLAAPGRAGANDRIITGHIGVGGMGSHHLKFLHQNAAAVCDVDKNHLARAVNAVGRDIDAYEDYRRVLDRDDIDAVFIVSPDHWHGVMAVHACQAGKDVYVEKPSSVTILEGRAMIEAARNNKRVMQVGSQGRSTEAAWQAATYIRNGQIGEVERIECWHTMSPTGGDPTKQGPPPPELNWDMWLGPVEFKPYNPDYCHFDFRWMIEWGGGNIRDRGAHVLSVAMWILQYQPQGPITITATGTPPVMFAQNVPHPIMKEPTAVPPGQGIWDCPPDMNVTWEFSDPKLHVTWAQPGQPRGDADFGAEYYGSNDSLIVTGGDGGVGTEDKAKNYTPPADGVEVFRSPGHHENFFDCMRTREKPIMDIEDAHLVASLCILANLSYRLGRPLTYDPRKERFIDDEAANLALGTPGRGEWHI